MGIPILNYNFNNWNQGSNFVNPANGTETADDWYSTRTGTFNLTNDFTYAQWTNATLPDSGIYQDVAVTGVSSLDFTLVTFANVTPFIASKLRVDDGFTVQDTLVFTTSNSVDTTVNFSININPLATSIRLTWFKNSTPGTGAQKFKSIEATANYEISLTETVTMTDSLFPILNNLFRLTLNDAMGLVEEFDPPTFAVKGFSETVRIQDWLRKRRRIPQNRWTN